MVRLRWYGRRQRRPGSRLIGCLLWLIAVVVVLIVLALLFGGFTKGTKVSGMAPLARPAAAQPVTAHSAAARLASLPPR